MSRWADFSFGARTGRERNFKKGGSIPNKGDTECAILVSSWKTVVATLISINLKHLKPAIQLPKKWYFPMFSRLMFCRHKNDHQTSQNQLTMINVPPAGWTLLRVSGCVLTGSTALENAGGISFRGGGVSVPWKAVRDRGIYWKPVRFLATLDDL